MALSAVINFSLLLFFLRKKISGLPLRGIFTPLLKILGASLAGATCSYFSLRVAVWAMGFGLVSDELRTFWQLFLQVAFAFSLGAFVYIAVLLLLKSKELETSLFSVKKYFRFRR